MNKEYPFPYFANYWGDIIDSISVYLDVDPNGSDDTNPKYRNHTIRRDNFSVTKKYYLPYTKRLYANYHRFGRRTLTSKKTITGTIDYLFNWK